MNINILAATLEQMHLGHLIGQDVLAELDPEEVSDYMDWVLAVIAGELPYLPSEAQVPYVCAG